MADAPKFIDGQGNIVELSPEQLRYAPSLGYIKATDEQIQKHELEQKYSTFPEMLKTAGEGAAQALTLGLSTHVEKALGVDPAAILARERANPISHAIGTGAGILAPLALTGGAAAPAEAGALGLGELTAPGLISGAGRAVSGAVEGLMGPATGFGGRLLGKAAGLGAGGAFEGGLWTTGQVIHEAALGDPHTVAEHALSQIGLGTLLGGALGAGLGAAGVAIPKAVAASREALGDLAQTARKATLEYYPEVASKFMGHTPEEIREILETGGKQNLLKPEFAKEFSDTLKAAHGANEDSMRVWHETMKPKQFETMLADAKQEAVLNQAQTHINDLRTYAQEIAAKPELPQGYATRAARLADALERDLKGKTDAAGIFTKLEDFKRELYHYSKPQTDPFAQEAAAGMAKLHESFRSGLENESVWGKAGAVQAKVNAAETALRDSQEALSREFTSRGEFDPKKVKTYFQNINDPATGATRAKVVDDFLKNSGDYNAALEESHKFVPTEQYSPSAHKELIEKTADGIQQARKEAHLSELMSEMGGDHAGLLGTFGESAMGSMALGSIAPGAGHAAGLALGPLHAVAKVASNPARVAEVLGKLQSLSNATSNAIDSGVAGLVKGSLEAAGQRAGRAAATITKAEFAEHEAQIHTLANNPEALHDTLSSATGPMYPHAPNTTDALHMVTSAGIAFLDSKLPQHAQLGPLAGKWEVTGAELAKYNRFKEGVYNPLSILKTPTAEGIEAVSTVYPKLMDQIRTVATQKIATQKGPIPYPQRQVLGQLLGQDLDGSHIGLLANQRINPPPQQAPGAVKGKGKPDKLTLSRRMMTPVSATANRERP